MQTDNDAPTIGVLTPFVGGIYAMGLLNGIEQVARRNGARVITIQTLQPWQEYSGRAPDQRAIPVAWDHCDGFIVILEAVNRADLQALLQAGKPCVRLSALPDGLACPAVLPDNRGGTSMAVRHLLEHGHRRIAFAGCLDQEDIRQRFAGYQETMAAAGLTDHIVAVPTPGFEETAGVAAARHLIAAGCSHSAIVAATDLLAVGLMAELQKEGFRIPDDIAIIGFDDIDAAQQTTPALASVRQRFDIVGSAAARLLLRQLRGASVPLDPVYVPATLIPRQSCGCWVAMVPPMAQDSSYQSPDWRAMLALDLSQQLIAPLPFDPQETPQDVWPSVDTVIAALDAAVADSQPPSAAAISRAWQEACVPAASAEVLTALVDRLHRAGVARLALPGAFFGGHDRLMAFLAATQLELLRATSLVRGLESRGKDAQMYASYRATMAMLGADVNEAAHLRWLHHAPVHWGHLGMWCYPAAANPATSGDLVIAGSFARDGDDALPLGAHCSVSAFPPDVVLDALSGAGGPRPMVIMPVATDGHHWGFLALAAQKDHWAHVAHDGMQQWAALLSIALERGAMLRSLEDQQTTLRHQALHDALTGLPNRTAFYDAATRTLRQSTATGMPVAVLILDLDRFKSINDSLGHSAGDVVLQQTAERLQGALRTSDMAARLGGDEFGVLLPDTDRGGAERTVARIIDALNRPLLVDGQTVTIGASIGIALPSSDSTDLSHLLRSADAAMYAVKGTGAAWAGSTHYASAGETTLTDI